MPSNHPTKKIYCVDCGYWFFVPVYCKNRFCPVCSKKRNKRIQYQLSQLIRTQIEEKSRRLRMLTLTIPNYPDAKEGCRVAQKSFRKLRNTRFWKARVRGGAYILEITKPAGGFHCHLHILLDSEFLPQATLVDLWSKVSPGHIVFIQEIPARAGIYYVTKYLTKAGDSEIDIKELNEMLRHFRLFQTFGTWHNVTAPMPRPSYRCPSCNSIHWLPEDVIEIMRKTAKPVHGYG